MNINLDSEIIKICCTHYIYGIRGVVQQGFKSYFYKRQQFYFL